MQPTINLNAEINGFLSLFNGFLTARGPIGFVVYGETVYNFSLSKWKNLFDGFDHRPTYGEWLDAIKPFINSNTTAFDVETQWIVYQRTQESERMKEQKRIQLKSEYQAEFENACDDLYYGYGYQFWRTHNNTIENDDDAHIVWQMAVKKMSK